MCVHCSASILGCYCFVLSHHPSFLFLLSFFVVVRWQEGDRVVKRIATGSCDNTVRVFKFSPAGGTWVEESKLGGNGVGHRDWVRDVAWAPSSGMPCNLIASCSEVHAEEQEGGQGGRKQTAALIDSVHMPNFTWSLFSSQDRTVIIWKQREAGGEWKPIVLKEFGSPVWRVSWSVTGNMLAVRSICVLLFPVLRAVLTQQANTFEQHMHMWACTIR